MGAAVAVEAEAGGRSFRGEFFSLLLACRIGLLGTISLTHCMFAPLAIISARRSSSFERMKRREREGKNFFRPDDRRD